MKIAFVHMGREHLGIEYLSAVAKKAGHEVRLYYDPGLFSQNDNVFYIPRLERRFDQKAFLIDRVVADRPDAVCITAYTTTFQWALSFAREVKERAGIPVLFGGLHVTLTSEEVLKHPEIDLAVIGEGEAVFQDALSALLGQKNPAHVQSLIWRNQGRATANLLHDPIEDLDSIPLPDKALFEQHVNFVDDYMIMTNRGCPFSCTYCCENAFNRMYGNRYFRRRSVGSVMDELEVMYDRYRFREVMFNDSIFFTHRDWLLELLEQYRARIHRPFRCFGQVAYLDDEIAQVLVRSGCYAIEFGVQTLNETLRKNILNRNETNEDNAKSFALCDRHKIHYDVDHIFGLPTEQEEDFYFAARFYSKLKYLNRIKCHYLTYFPGTKIFDVAVEQGIIGAEDSANIRDGKVGDFFHEGMNMDEASAALAKDFHKFFKILPLLPASWTETILQKKWFRTIAKLPSPATILFQVFAAVKGRDYRFFLYLKYYLFRLKRNWHILKYNGRRP